jgi:hypothetical protein
VFEKVDSEHVWEEFRDNQVSISKAQKEINKLFLVQKGFFKRLEDNLTSIVTERISNETSERLSTAAYLRRQRNLRKELIQKLNWVNFWLSCPWLNAPTIEDIETIRSLPESRLADYLKLIRESLRQFSKRDLSKSMEASILKSYYLLLAQEMRLKTDMKRSGSRGR